MSDLDLDPRRLAARVIVKVLAEEAFAAAVLSAELDRLPQMAARDRGLATELTYGTLRAARYLEGELAALAPRGLGGLDATPRAPLLIFFGFSTIKTSRKTSKTALDMTQRTRLATPPAIGGAIFQKKTHFLPIKLG